MTEGRGLSPDALDAISELLLAGEQSVILQTALIVACLLTRSNVTRLIAAALLAFAIAVTAFAIYANSLPVPFLLDDLTTISGNTSIRQLWPVSAVLFPPPEVYSAGRPLLNATTSLWVSCHSQRRKKSACESARPLAST